MEMRILESIAARAGGSCAVAVAGPPQCGKSAVLRALASGCGGAAGEDGGFAVRLEGGEVSAAEGRPAGCRAALLVTTDGSFGVPRAPAEEEKIAQALEAEGIPFLVLVNAADPASAACEGVRAELEGRWGAALALNTEAGCDAEEIFSALLLCFPPVRLDLFLPDWLAVLPEDSKSAADILARVRAAAPAIRTLRGCASIADAFADGDLFCESCETDAETGRAVCRLAAKEGAFYRALSEECGAEIAGDLDLMAYVRSLREAKGFYDKFGKAFAAAESSGYAVVQPDAEARLLPPELLRRGAKCGVRLRADAPSYHVVRVDVHSDVSPITGEGEQGEQLARNMLDCYGRDADAFWNTDMFGRTFRDMVCDGLREKTVPLDARDKLRRALVRIVNEGKGGVLCILL